MYSIASSQEAVDDEVHIAVSVVRYEGYGRYKEGFCSSFLSDRVHTDEQVKVFIDPNTRFKLPANPDSPIIMVGAGTGVARSEEHTSELQSLMRISYAVFCLK